MAKFLFMLVLTIFAPANALSENTAKSEEDNAMAANPIRKVVTLLQMMQKKVEAEGVKEAELFEKFMCYCKSSGETLAKSLADADVKMPQLASDIKEAESAKAQLQEEVTQHQNDRDEAKAAMAKATEIREKEAAAFAKESANDKANIQALMKATAAIEKGMSGGFLQTSSAAVLRRLVLSQDISNSDRDMLTSFLTAGDGQGYAPASGEIVGILKQLGDTMDKDYKDLVAQEEAAIKAFEELMAAKQKEVDAAIAAVESKIKRIGELGIEIVNLKEDLDDTTAAFMEDQKFLADLKKNCATKEKEWAERQKTRQEELLAIADTIKILNDDDALELFKKTAGASASLLQVQLTNKQMVRQALKALGQSGKRRNVGLDLIALALTGKKVDFTKVIKMIDDMVVLLGKEQADDDHKKEFCTMQFDLTDDKKKDLERTISDLEKAIAEDKEMVETLKSEIEALQDGIVKLDREVAEATMIRKEEHADFSAELTANKAASDIIDFAKNRLNKFYNPKLYKPPPKRELTEEERITLNMGGTLAPTNPPGGIAGTGIGLDQTGSASIAAPPPPPETFGDYKKKGEESSGVIGMMDMLKADLQKEITEMEVTEQNAQEEYEAMVKDAADKRAADSLSIEEKESAKAGAEADLVKAGDDKAGAEDELMATKKYIADLHAECDWLLNNFQTRKEARTAEVEALKNAKAVLSGADYSFVQIRRTKHFK
jgi:chromosome segregation ATPase